MSNIIDPVEINSIQLMADGSYPRRVVVPLTLREDLIFVQTMAFLDIGLMTNFINDCFARVHDLKLTKKEIPLMTKAFNGEQGADVIWELNGHIEAVGIDGSKEEFETCLNVTRLGEYEVMIGLPWMEDIGCVLKLVKGGSYVLFGGSTLISAIVVHQNETTTLLPALEISYNSSIHYTTGKNPFVVERGFCPRSPHDALSSRNVYFQP